MIPVETVCKWLRDMADIVESVSKEKNDPMIRFSTFRYWLGFMLKDLEKHGQEKTN